MHYELVGRAPAAPGEVLAKAIAFHPDGKSLAVEYLDGRILLGDVARRQATGAPVEGHVRRRHSGLQPGRAAPSQLVFS